MDGGYRRLESQIEGVDNCCGEVRNTSRSNYSHARWCVWKSIYGSGTSRGNSVFKGVRVHIQNPATPSHKSIKRGLDQNRQRPSSNSCLHLMKHFELVNST